MVFGKIPRSDQPGPPPVHRVLPGHDAGHPEPPEERPPPGNPRNVRRNRRNVGSGFTFSLLLSYDNAFLLLSCYNDGVNWGVPSFDKNPCRERKEGEANVKTVPSLWVS